LDKRQEGGGRGDEKEGRRDLFGRRRRAGERSTPSEVDVDVERAASSDETLSF